MVLEKHAYPLLLGILQTWSPHWRSPLVPRMFLWTPYPCFSLCSHPHWRHLMSCRLLFCLQTFGFQNYTLVRHFIHLLVYISIFFHIRIHVLLPSFLIHFPLQTLSHHLIHIIVQILNFLGFLVFFYLCPKVLILSNSFIALFKSLPFSWSILPWWIIATHRITIGFQLWSLVGHYVVTMLPLICHYCIISCPLLCHYWRTPKSRGEPTWGFTKV
jgi:hypothetical protein